MHFVALVEFDGPTKPSMNGGWKGEKHKQRKTGSIIIARMLSQSRLGIFYAIKASFLDEVV